MVFDSDNNYIFKKANVHDDQKVFNKRFKLAVSREVKNYEGIMSKV